MPEDKKPVVPSEKPADKPKTDEQVAQELAAKFLSPNEFAITKTGGKIYVNVYDYTKFWWACCKIGSMKPKLAWPANVEIRHVKSSEEAKW